MPSRARVMLSSHRLWPTSWSLTAALTLRSRSNSSTSPSRRRWRASVLGVAPTKAATTSAATSGAHDPRAEGEDVDVVVLDHLVGGVVVGPVGGPDPGQPVGGDGDPRPAAAHEDPPLGLGRGQAVADQLGDHRVVDALGRGGVGAEQDGLVAGVGDRLRHTGAQRQAGVVGGDGDPHGRTPPELVDADGARRRFWNRFAEVITGCTSLRTWSATFSGVNAQLGVDDRAGGRRAEPA